MSSRLYLLNMGTKCCLNNRSTFHFCNENFWSLSPDQKKWTICQIYQKAWNEPDPLILLSPLIAVIDHITGFNCRQSQEILSLVKVAYPVLYDLQTSILLHC